jgi:hypothetical protein
MTDTLPAGPSKGALKALEAAKVLARQTNPAIWFDSWYNDGRDNNNDKVVDDAGEKGKKNTDGAHYKRTYTARIAPVPVMSPEGLPDWMVTTINVMYKVCIDIPIESYIAAGVPICRTRWIPTFFATLKHMPGWKVWSGKGQLPTLMDGDIVAACNKEHQHAGIVETGIIDSIINIPGPTSQRRYGLLRPSGRNDICSVPRVLFEAILGIDRVARWIGK